MTESIYRHTIDEVFSALGTGSLDRALTDNFYGINLLQTPGMVTGNRDQAGYVFATRPQLNLQKDNLRNYPELYHHLTDNPNSLAKAVRMLLDPRLGAGYRFKTLLENGKIGYREIPPMFSPLVDNNSAFIPFITNNTISLTGWPDTLLPTTSSDPGLHKQVFTWGDGIVRNYGEYDLSLNIQNTMGDPASLLFNLWLHYIGAVKEGTMDPYHDYIMNNRLDYNTRFYRLVVDQRKEIVTKMFCCIASMPLSNPTGMFADYNRSTPFNEQTKEISFRIKATGFRAYEPIIMKDFNDVVGVFNMAMKDRYREANMKKLVTREYKLFRHRVYPRINPDSSALEWWVPADVYTQRMSGDISDLQNHF